MKKDDFVKNIIFNFEKTFYATVKKTNKSK